MAEPVIRVENLGKKYRIGKAEKKADTIAGAILNGLKSPLTNLKQIRNLSKLDVEDDSVFWALRDINFEVQEGEVLGIIGHNGAGKSTLLKILSQITEPSTGQLKIRGRVASLLEVGTGFHPELTGRENIYMNGTILGMTKKEISRKLDEIVDFSGVEKHLDTPVKFYSSGMRVRLGFAVAAHLEPEILIIDEVLSVGDAEFQKKCLGKMGDVAKQGRTVLFVSHNMEATRSLCKKGLLLNKGAVEFHDEINNVVNKYLVRYTKGTLNNYFDTSNQPGNDQVRLKSAEVVKPKQGEIITTETEIQFRFAFDALKPVSDFNLSLVLWTISGNCIFNVISSVVQLESGSHEARLVVPANLLNDEMYSVELYFVARSSVLFKISDLIVFEVLDAPRNVLWFGKWIGAVRPKLNFSIDSIS